MVIGAKRKREIIKKYIKERRRLVVVAGGGLKFYRQVSTLMNGAIHMEWVLRLMIKD